MKYVCKSLWKKPCRGPICIKQSAIYSDFVTSVSCVPDV